MTINISTSTVLAAKENSYKADSIEEYESILEGKIVEQVKNFNVEVKLSSLKDKKNTNDEISESLENVREGLRGSIHHMNLGDVKVEMKSGPYTMEISHDIDYKNTNKDFESSDNTIHSFINKNINDEMTDYEKIYEAYKYTIDKLNYGTVGNVNKDRNMVEGLNGKPVVCEAYAFVFHQLMQHMNFESEIVLGDADKVAHAWNIVNINGKWLHVDPTWGDGKDGSVDLDYFLVTESEIQKKGNRTFDKGTPKSTRKLSDEDKLIKSSIVKDDVNVIADSDSVEQSVDNKSLPSSLVIIAIIGVFFIGVIIVNVL